LELLQRFYEIFAMIHPQDEDAAQAALRILHEE
jgi:hypothetical protein